MLAECKDLLIGFAGLLARCSGSGGGIGMATRRGCVAVVASSALTAAVLVVAPAQTALGEPGAAAAGCQLHSAKGDIQHVIYLQFDNTHFLRDNPNVPSDVEQMPHLLDFLRDNGTFDTNDHTVLISHTGGGTVEPDGTSATAASPVAATLRSTGRL